MISRSIGALLLCLACATAQAQATFVFLAGQVDNFAAPADPATASARLTALLAPSPVQNFDLTAGLNGGAGDRQVAHTFSGVPGNIVAATLEMRVRGGNLAGVDSDGLVVSFADLSTPTYLSSIAYRRTFGPFAGGGTVFADPDEGLVQSTAWSSGNQATIVLDLAALPLSGTPDTVDLRSMLNAKGFLDVVVADETAVDFYRLTVTTIPEPETSALFLAGLGLLGFAARRRIRGRSPNP